MKTFKKTAFILPLNASGPSCLKGDKLYLNDISRVSDADGDVVLYSKVYEEIFGITRKLEKDANKRLAIVKISANGKSIHRAFRAVSGMTSDYAGLTANSLRLLNDSIGTDPVEVELSPGSCLPYYWRHPDKAIRISIKLGLLSVLLGLISVINAVITLF